VKTKFAGTRHDRRFVAPWIQPDPLDALRWDLDHYTRSDVWLDVDGGNLDRPGDINYRRVSGQALNLSFAGVDWNHGIPPDCGTL